MKAFAAATALAFKIITHNIREPTSPPETEKNEQPWEVRGPILYNELAQATQQSPGSLICTQENTQGQTVDIMDGLNNHSAPGSPPDDWAFIGVGQDDGQSKGQHSPLYYQKSAWKLDEWTTYWLSPTPEKPSRGWDAASNRIVTVGRFEHVSAGKQVVGMCTHFDDKGAIAQRESAKLILKLVGDWTKKGPGNLPVFLGGDFNSQTDSDAYREFTAPTSPFQDSHDIAEQRAGPEMTYTGFQGEQPKRYDFLYVGPKESKPWTVEKYDVLENKYNGVYESDHRAIALNVRI